METVNFYITKMVYKLLINNNFKPIDLAKLLGIHQGKLSGYLTNRVRWNHDILINIAKHFGVSLNYLYGLEEEDIIKSKDQEIESLKAKINERDSALERICHSIESEKVKLISNIVESKKIKLK